MDYFMYFINEYGMVIIFALVLGVLCLACSYGILYIFCKFILKLFKK